ncbi:MAG: hypothetical protein KBT88_08465 [Gammaproteobacteria bacterium]|nr:hypothetical protein [Gammaproteobacteria bacterium]MBQ0839807.1 hypothetical protein [Gammaproteobacteria bacterium]
MGWVKTRLRLELANRAPGQDVSLSVPARAIVQRVLLALGLCLSLAASAQVTIDYSYDDLNRLQTVSRGDGPSIAYVYDEVSNITVQTVSNSPDSDDDLLADFADPDDDNDQMPDTWELYYGLDPLNPLDANSDVDGDGVTAVDEFFNGTDPVVNNNSSDDNGEEIPFLPLWALALLAGALGWLGKPKVRSSSPLVLFLVLGLCAGLVDNAVAAPDIANLVMPSAVRHSGAAPGQKKKALRQRAITAPDPGWYQSEAEPVSAEEARQILGEPDVGGDQNADLQFSAQSAFATASDYSALAEALENDPRRIYQYVRNHFEYVPYYGALKGPYLTLHERAGNDFDQAALLIELLRAAGYTANFRYGLATVSPTDPQALQELADWLGVEADAQLIVNTFANGGVPVAWYSNNRIEFDHVWVEATINANVVSLDPAFKLSTTSPTLDLDSAMGFDEGSLLAAAGGSVTADSIANLNEGALGAYLSTLTNTFQSYLKANYPNARVEEVIGGYSIIPDNSTLLPTVLPLPVAPTFAAWATVPSTYVHTVHLVHGGIDALYDIPDIAGRKLSIRYAGDNVVIDPLPAGASDFGSVAIGGDGPTFAWNPDNPNTVVIQITSTLSGADASAFAFVSGAGTQSIPANGGSVNVSVKLTGLGQTAGRKNAVLTFDYSYNGSSIGVQSVDLSGVVEADRVAEIYIDDVLSVSEGTPSGNLNDLSLSINHPYAANGGAFADQTTTFKLDRGGSFVLASAFGGDKHSTLLAERQRLLSRMSLEGRAEDDPAMVSETLNIIGQTWLQQTQLNDDLLAALSGVRGIRHHRFGIAGQNAGYYVDVKAQYVSSSARIVAAKEGSFPASGLIASAMEHSVLEQTQGADKAAVSTVKIFALNNQNGARLFLANSGNYASVQGQLVNYSAGDKANFQAAVNAGHTLILPENGAVSLNQWSGKGYVDYLVSGSSRSLGMIIGGGLNGGLGTSSGPVSPSVTSNESRSENTPSQTVAQVHALDPVDLGSGAFLSNMTDLALGGTGPRGLSFSRSYNSQQVGQNSAGLGQGWTHNYDLHLAIHSDVGSALGTKTPFEALPLLVAAHAARHLMAPAQPALENWAVAALIADWATDQLLNKSVTLHLGSQALTFKELPDGRFVSPAGISAELLRLGDNTFELRQRFGTVLSFNANNAIASISDIDGNTLSFSYSGEQLSQVTDSYGRTLTLNYSGTQLSSVSDSTGRTLTYGYSGDTLTSVTGLENALWQYGYDSLSRMLTVTDPENTMIVDNTYDDFDRVVQQVAPRETGSATYKLHYTGLSSSEEKPDGDRLTYYFDHNTRAIGVEDALGHRTATQYDGQGHGIAFTDTQGRTSTLVYDNHHNLIEARDPLNQLTSFNYDAQHRLTQATDALGHSSETDFDAEHHSTAARDALNNEATVSYRADGLVATTTDPRATTSTYSYDSQGFPSSSQTGSHPAVLTRYDSIGRLLSLTDQAGAVTSFSHDNRGLITSRTDPLNKTATMSYNALGQLVSQTDRNGDTYSATYTASQKLNVISYPARAATASHPAVSGFSVDFDYDLNRDRLSSMTGPLGITSNTYDVLDRLTSHTDPLGHQVQYSYDEVSNLTQITYPDGKTVSYSYDTLDRVGSISIDWLNKTASTTYDATSRLTQVDNFNGSYTTYDYDNADRLTNLAHHQSGGQLLADYSFTLDANGNRIQATISNEPILPETLINATHSQSFNAQKNRLVSAVTNEAINFSYDNEGQTQTVTGASTSNSYIFDGAHRLTGYNSNGQSNSYQYDGVGNRLSATRNGISTQYIYDAAGNLLAEANSSGTITRYYIHGLGLMAFVDAQTNQLYVYHHDATGHTVAITDINQNVVNKYAYDPYGQLMAKQEQIAQPFTYVGQYGVMTEAQDSDLYYMRARYYDAEIGRFISEDPIGMAGGINLYAYVGGNPVMLVDPSGLYAGYGNGPYGNYYVTKRASEAAGRKEYADASAAFGDALTIATPISGPLAPYIGAAATGLTILSMGLDSSQNGKTGFASLAIEKSVSILLKKVQVALELTESAVAAGSALAVTPVSLSNMANRVSEKGSVSAGKPEGW